MSVGSVVEIDTQQLLRAIFIGVAFARARMSAVYRYLRGVDPTSGEGDAGVRVKRLTQLDQAAKECIDTMSWSIFLLLVEHSGFVACESYSFKERIVNAYTFYIRGRKCGEQIK